MAKAGGKALVFLSLKAVGGLASFCLILPDHILLTDFVCRGG